MGVVARIVLLSCSNQQHKHGRLTCASDERGSPRTAVAAEPGNRGDVRVRMRGDPGCALRRMLPER